MQKKRTSFIKSKLSWGIISVIIFYFLIEVIWKELFFTKNIFGPYWVFIFTDKTTLYLPSVFFIFFLMDYVVNRKSSEKDSNTIEVLRVSVIGTFFAAWIYLFGVFPDGRYTFHLAELKTEGKAYYLAAYKVDSIACQYKLYECDSLGILCKSRYESDWLDDVNSRMYEYGEMIYIQKDNKVVVKAFVDYEKVEIYEFTLPH
jgi:hypothetical protein